MSRQKSVTRNIDEFGEITADGWSNVLTGLGVLGKDKRENTVAVTDTMTYDGLATLYTASDLAARIVDLPSEDMTREGWDINITDDEETSEEMGAALEALDTDSAIEQALKFKRLYGGGAILIGANDGTADLAQPLNLDRLRSVDYLTVFDAFEARPIEWESNPTVKGFSEPTLFQLNPHGILTAVPTLQKVHASRMLVFRGPIANRRRLRNANAGISAGWGDSVLIQIARLIRDYDGAWGGVGNLLTDFAQSVFKIKGLANALMADKDLTIKKRMQMINLGRSMINATMLDADKEEYDRKVTSMAGVPDVLREFKERVAAAAGMTSAKLFSSSPGGLGASGAGDNSDRAWYDKVRAYQKRQIKPQLIQLCKAVMASKEGPCAGVEPEHWSPIFRSLWQMTDVEKSQVRLAVAQTAQIYVNLGAASALDVAESHLSGDEYSLDLKVDLDALEEREAQAQEMADVTHEATVTNLQEHGQTTPPAPPKVAPPTKDRAERLKAALAKAGK